MDLSELEKKMKQIQDLKKNKESMLNQFTPEEIEQDPHKIAAELGIDLTKLKSIDTEKLKAIAASLTGHGEIIEKEVLNPDNPKAKGVQNITNKINKQGFDPEKDGKTVANLFNSFLEEEQTSRAEQCFHYNKSECQHGIIHAHSVQKKGPLKKISIQENNQFLVTQFKRELLTNNWEAGIVSIKDASTFRGFCKKHDSMFELIENEDYSGSAQQNFLHSYRSFAYSYHKKLEHYSYWTNLIETTEISLNGILGNMSDLLQTVGALGENQVMPSTDGLQITDEQKATVDADKFEEHKAQLNEALKNDDYNSLDYFSLELDHICPIVCASLVKLHVETNRGYIISDPSKIYNGYPMMITILHTPRNTSIILLSRFKSDLATEIIFNQLRLLTKVQQEERLSTLIFEQVENFFLAPSFWNYLPESEKSKINNDLNQEKEQFPYRSTFTASLNIFDKIHQLK